MKLNNLNSSTQELLKYIALLLMTTDHAGAILYGHYEGLHLSTMLGRLVFPIFAYLVIYNYLYHTRSKKKYIKRLFVFALISQIPYHFAFYEIHGRFTFNVLFTLGFGLWYIYLLEEHVSRIKSRLDKIVFGFILSFAALLIIGMWGDFSIQGILTMIGFYLYLKRPNIILLFALGSVLFLLNMQMNVYYGRVGALSLIVIYLFNRVNIAGVKRMVPGVGFYVYYPLHLSALIVFALL